MNRITIISKGLFVLLLVCLIGCTPTYNPREIKEGFFKYYQFTNKGPLGILEIENTVGKPFYEIKKISDFEYMGIEYDERGKIKASITYFLDDAKIIDKLEHTDKWGFKYKIEYFEKLDNDNLINRSNAFGKNEFSPCNAVMLVFNENGVIIEKSCLDKQNRKYINSEGFVATKYHYFDNGLDKGHSFWDKNGRPINRNQGYHRVEYERNQNSCITSKSYFDTKGNPCTIDKGYHKSIIAVDRNCNKTSVEYYGINGARMSDEFGVHKYYFVVANGLILKEVRLDSELKPTKKISDGIHIIRNQYDANGNLIAESYFDSDDNKVKSNAGYHTVRYTYKDGKFLETELYLDDRLLPAYDKYEIHKYFYARNKKNWLLAIAYFGAKGQSIKHNVSDVYMMKYEYDSFGRYTEFSYWKNERVKMNSWTGIHSYETQYNDQGLLSEVISFDKSGNLQKEIFGASQRRFEYDSLGRVKVVSNWHKNTPVFIKKQLCVGGYHKKESNYSNAGLVNELLFFNKDNSPVNVSFCTIDIAAHRVGFIYNGDVIVEQRFYKKGNEIPSKVQNCLKEECLNTSGNAVIKLN